MRKLQSTCRTHLRAAPPPCRKAGSHPIRLGLKMLPVILSVGAICNAYTYLGQQIKDSGRMIGKYRAEMKRVNREIENLRAREEALSSRSYISSRIAHFQLNLQEPTYEQTQRLVIRSANPHAPRSYRIGQR